MGEEGPDVFSFTTTRNYAADYPLENYLVLIQFYYVPKT